MIGLHETKYSTVCLKPKRILPWIVAKDHYAQICENAAYLQNLKDSKISSRIDILKKLETQSNILPTIEESLELLGVVIEDTQESFISQTDYKKHRDESIVTVSEKYLFPAVESSGAGRHALLKNAQLKAIGRNVLCTNEDYFHSWGGLTIQDALKGYVTSEYVNRRAKLPCLDTLGMFLYEEEILPLIKGVVILRDAKSFRLAQLYPNTLNENERVSVKKHLENYFKHKDPALMLKNIFENYIHAYAHGIKHEALSPDNLLIDGRWIDTESLNINLDKTSQDLWIQVSNPLPENKIFIERFQQLEVFQKENQCVFRDSWIHRLFLMCQATHFIYDSLWEGLDFNLTQEFENLIKEYFPKIDHAYWFKLLSIYDSKHIYKFSIPRKKSNDSRLFQVPEGLELNGYYFDTTEGHHVLTFSGQRQTSHDLMQSLVKKWEKVFYPVQLNLNAASELADQIKKISLL